MLDAIKAAPLEYGRQLCDATNSGGGGINYGPTSVMIADSRSAIMNVESINFDMQIYAGFAMGSDKQRQSSIRTILILPVPFIRLSYTVDYASIDTIEH